MMADIEGQVTMVTVAHMMQTHDDDEVVSDSDTPNTSAISSGSSNTFSDLAESSFLSRKHKLAAQKWSKKEKKKQKDIEKKKKKNKIAKEDFYAKITEFKVWLSEVKKVQFDNLDSRQHKEYFKKFVRKWNARKLQKKYYRGLDVLWAQGTPDTQVNWATVAEVEMTPGSIEEDALERRYSRADVTRAAGLGTFGKNAGAKMLRELRNLDNALESESVTSVEKSVCPLPAKPRSKLLALEQMFLPPDDVSAAPGTTHYTHKKNHPSISSTEDEHWPAPPSPYTAPADSSQSRRLESSQSQVSLAPPPPYTGHTTEHTADGTMSTSSSQSNLSESDQSDGMESSQSQVSQTTLKQAVVGEISRLPCRPRTASEFDLQHHTSRLVKVGIPCVRPVVACRPPTVPRTKPRPSSCIDSVLPDRPVPPPRRTSSTDDVMPGSHLPLPPPGDVAENRRRFYSANQSQCCVPPPPPKRTVSLDKLPQDPSLSASSMNQRHPENTIELAAETRATLASKSTSVDQINCVNHTTSNVITQRQAMSTTNPVNSHQLQENSHKLQEPGNTYQLQEPVKSDQLHNQVNSDQLHNQVNSDQLHNQVNFDQLHNQVNSDKFHKPAHSEQNQKSVNSDQLCTEEQGSVNHESDPSRTDAVGVEILGVRTSDRVTRDPLPKRPLSQSEMIPDNCSRFIPQRNASESMPRCVSQEPHKKVGRQDSYISGLSSASYAVFQTLTSTKGSVKPGQVTPVRLKSNDGCRSTPYPPQGGAMTHPHPGGATIHPAGATTHPHPGGATIHHAGATTHQPPVGVKTHPGGATNTASPSTDAALTPRKSSCSTNL